MDDDKIVGLLVELTEKVGKVQSSVETHSNQLGMIFSKINEGGDHCPQGARNATAIKWLYAVGSIVTTAVFGVIAFFHVKG